MSAKKDCPREHDQESSNESAALINGWEIGTTVTKEGMYISSFTTYSTRKVDVTVGPLPQR